MITRRRPRRVAKSGPLAFVARLRQRKARLARLSPAQRAQRHAMLRVRFAPRVGAVKGAPCHAAEVVPISRRPRQRQQRRPSVAHAVAGADDGEPPPRVLVTYATEDDLILRSRAISIIRDLLRSA